MKICPVCQQNYPDDSLNFCLADGAALISTEFAARQVNSRREFETAPNRLEQQTNSGGANAFDRQPKKSGRTLKFAAAAIAGLLLLGGVAGVIAISLMLNSRQNFVQTNSQTVNNSPPSAPSAASATTAGAMLNNAKSNVTLAAYNQLKTGMSYDEAARIVGSQGTEMSSTEAAGYKTVTVKWEADNYQYLFAVFQNDKLISKTQSNLK